MTIPGTRVLSDHSSITDGQANKWSFLSHAAIYGLGTLLMQAANIFLLPLYTHYLTPADFGTLEILARTGQVIGIFLMVNGIGTATFTFYCQASTAEERQKVSSSLAVLSGVLRLGGGLLVVAFAQPLGAIIGVESPMLTAVGILVPFFDAATLVPMVLAQARTESVFFVCASLAMFVCRVAMLVVAVAYFGWGIWGVLGASILNSALFGAALNLREFRKKSFRPDLQIIHKASRFAFPFLFSGLCFFVMSAGDRFFLVKTAGTDELGVYALGYKLALAVGVFSFMPLFKVWSARVYRVFAQPNAAARVGHMVTLLLGAYLFVGLAVCILADDVLAVLAPPAYAGAAAVVAPIVLAQFFNCAATLMDSVFYVHHRTRSKAWTALASAVVMCSLYAALIPKFGAMGAACASLGGFAFHAAVTLGVSQRIFRVNYETGRLAVMLFLAILLVLISRGLTVGFHNLPPKVLLVILWPAAIWFFGVISKQDKRRILETAGPAFHALWRWARPAPKT